MNIFVLDRDPELAARYHCDIHVGKMLVESAQLMSTAHHVLDEDAAIAGIYKETHVHHPCAVWVRQCEANYDWVWYLAYNLAQEFLVRYHKQHKTQDVVSRLAIAPKNLSKYPIGRENATGFALAMPDQYKSNDPVESYRAYYQAEKATIAKWNHGPTPPWWKVNQ